MEKFQRLKQKIDIENIAIRYGIILKNGKGLCPFHNEKTASFSVDRKKQIFKYFGCNTSGDAITLVAMLHNISNSEAVCLINRDYGFLSFTPKTKYERIKKSKEVSTKQKLLKAAEDFYWKTLEEYIRLDLNRIKYAPISLGDELHPLFEESLEKLAQQEYLLDRAEIRLRGFRIESR